MLADSSSTSKIVLAFALVLSSCSEGTVPKGASDNSVEKQSEAEAVVKLALASKEIFVGDNLVLDIEVTAPHNKDLTIIKFERTRLPYSRFGATLYGPDGKLVPGGMPSVLPTHVRLEDEDAIIVKAGTTVRGRIPTHHAPQMPGEHTLSVTYSPTLRPTQNVYRRLQFTAVDHSSQDE